MRGGAEGETQVTPRWAGSPTRGSIPQPVKIMSWAKITSWTRNQRRHWMLTSLRASPIASHYVQDPVLQHSLWCGALDWFYKEVTEPLEFVDLYPITSKLANFQNSFKYSHAPLFWDPPIIMHMPDPRKMGTRRSLGLCSLFFTLFFRSSHRVATVLPLGLHTIPSTLTQLHTSVWDFIPLGNFSDSYSQCATHLLISLTSTCVFSVLSAHLKWIFLFFFLIIFKSGL